ncbi:MAG: hypothetical protein KY476_16955 [Planctomycetes bacterium]|nr:hypothetical protein [Planctomycetota bacterium]
MRYRTVFAFVVAITAGDAARAELPEGNTGIAARYPGDVAIAEDRRVVFVEDFEAAVLGDVTRRWDEVNDRFGNLALDDDVPAGSGGKRSLAVTHVGGKGDGGHLFRRLEESHETLFARWYVKFDPACAPVHHFGTHLGGYNPPTRWPQPFAGQRPPGDKRFTTGVEPFGKAWRWDFYTYWSRMRSSPPRGQHWGNDFVNDPALKVERGRWICIELMVKMNDPGKRNGEQAFWIDGKLWRAGGQVLSHLGPGFPRGKWVHDSWLPDPDGEPFEGFEWRTTPELGVNNVWTYLYITGAPEGHVSRVWFDHIVLAREYIGPLREARIEY